MRRDLVEQPGIGLGAEQDELVRRRGSEHGRQEPLQQRDDAAALPWHDGPQLDADPHPVSPSPLRTNPRSRKARGRKSPSPRYSCGTKNDSERIVSSYGPGESPSMGDVREKDRL